VLYGRALDDAAWAEVRTWVARLEPLQATSIVDQVELVYYRDLREHIQILPFGKNS
jgi:hypothetical protein